MRRLFYLLSLAVLTLACLLGGCSDNHRAAALLSRADSLMDSRPNSALTVLDSCEAEAMAWPKAQQMRFHLLQAKARNKAYVPFTTDSVMTVVADYYDRRGTSNEQVEAHYLLGCVYRDLGEAPKALEYFQLAVSNADTLSLSCDYRLLMSIYGQMAELYHSQSLPDNEIQSREMCRHYALLTNDTLNYIRAYELMLKPYFLLGDTDKVIEVIDSTRRMYIHLGHPEKSNGDCAVLAHIYLKRGQLKEARELLLQYEGVPDLFDSLSKIKPGRESYYYIKGSYYLTIQNLDSAEYFFRKLSSTHLKADEYRGFLSLYNRNNETDSIIKYARLYEAAVDSQNSTRRTAEIVNMTSLYNYHRYQHQAEVESLSASQLKIRYQAIVAVMLFLLLLTFVYYRKYRSHKIQEIVLLTSNYDRAKSEYSKLHQLHTQILHEKTEELQKLSESVSSYERRFQLLKQRDRESALVNSDIVRTLREKTNWRKDQVLPTESEWDLLLRLFAQNMPSTFEAVGGRSVLSLLELRTCILVLLGFSNKDLTILFNVKQQRISNLKEIINFKLFGERTATSLRKNLRTKLAHREVL